MKETLANFLTTIIKVLKLFHHTDVLIYIDKTISNVIFGQKSFIYVFLDPVADLSTPKIKILI